MLKRNTHPGTTAPITARPRTRLFAGACAVVLASTLSVGLTACANDADSTKAQHAAAVQASERTVGASLTSQLESLVTQDVDEALAREGVDAGELASLGAGEDALAGAYLEGFDFSVDSVQVNGDFASATVTLEAKTPETLRAAVSDAFGQLVESGSLDEAGADDSNQLIGETVLDAVAGAQTVQTSPVTVSLSNENGTWTLEPDSANAILRTIMDS